MGILLFPAFWLAWSTLVVGLSGKPPGLCGVSLPRGCSIPSTNLLRWLSLFLTAGCASPTFTRRGRPFPRGRDESSGVFLFFFSSLFQQVFIPGCGSMPVFFLAQLWSQQTPVVFLILFKVCEIFLPPLAFAVRHVRLSGVFPPLSPMTLGCSVSQFFLFFRIFVSCRVSCIFPLKTFSGWFKVT